MRKFSTYIKAADAPKALALALGHMGSLLAPREMWQALCNGLTGGFGGTEAAAAIVRHAVPEEGDIHPVRAGVVGDDYYQQYVMFATPGSVSVTVAAAGGGDIRLEVDFHRNSTLLATQVAASLLAATGERRFFALVARAATDGVLDDASYRDRMGGTESLTICAE